MHIFFHHETAAKGYAKVVNVICPHAFVCICLHVGISIRSFRFPREVRRERQTSFSIILIR
jgi:hypothetical protein